MDPGVERYLQDDDRWRAELKRLRAVLLDCGLTEQFKWRKPAYSYADGNVAVLMRYKEFAALNFLKGVLLEDPDNALVAPGENSQAARQMRFTSVGEIAEREVSLRGFVAQAIELEKAGRKVEFKAKRDLTLPDELVERFDEVPSLKSAFEALSPGRQRAYVLHIAGAKQPATRVARVAKCEPRILAGKGMNDPE